MKSCLLFLGLLILATIGCKEKKEIPVAEKMNNFWVGDTSTVVHGIDVSYHQFEIDWKKVKEHGVSFVFVKATEGVDYLDSMFVKNWKQLEEENMLRAAYHFYISDDDPIQQAEWFVKNIGDTKGVLPPVMDVERAGHDHLTPEEYGDKLSTCLNHFVKLTGKMPILYSGPNFAKKYLSRTEFAKYKLWIAEYGVEKPTIPDVWIEPGWDFWQNTSKARVPGISVEVDRSVFNGKFHNLLSMIE